MKSVLKHSKYKKYSTKEHLEQSKPATEATLYIRYEYISQLTDI